HIGYVVLTSGTRAASRSRPPTESNPHPPAWRASPRALVAAGPYVAGAPPRAASTATTIRSKGGLRHVQDGPFAESKDQLGGIAIVDFESLDAALDWAARCPAAATGAVEVRPMDVSYLEMVARP